MTTQLDDDDALTVDDPLLTDRRPLEFDGRWLWHNAGHKLNDHYADDAERPRDHLPEAVFRQLAGFIARDGRVTTIVRAYPTKAAAVEALNAVLAAMTALTADLTEAAAAAAAMWTDLGGEGGVEA